MGSFRNKFRIEVSASGYLIGALALLVIPLKWLMAAAAAAAVHELCHMLAVTLCGSRIRSLKIGASGAVIDVSPMSRGKELLCALAGPCGGLMLLFFAKWFPRTAVCAAFHSAYNLLPIYPLDGGRALRCGAAILLPPPAADWVCLWTERVIKALLLGVGIYGSCVLKLGLMPLILGILMALRGNPVKNPCKESCQRVQ